MLSLSLGPLALPVMPLLVLSALGAASWLTKRLALRHAEATTAQRAGDALWWAAGAGLLAARAVYLLLHRDAYAANAWDALDLRDGGWHATSGWLVGALVLTARAQALGPLLRAPLAWGAALAWLVVNTAQGVLAITHPTPLPAHLAVVDLATGRPTTLQAAAAGRPVVLNLWATWCGPCRAEMPLLAAAQQANPDVAFLFVNQGEAATTVQAFVQRAVPGLQQVLLDERSRAGPLLGSQGLPTTVFYTAQGQRISAHLGALNASALATRIQAIKGAPRQLGAPA